MQPVPPIPVPQRRSLVPRKSLFYFALVIVLGVVFFLTSQSLQGKSGASWTYTQLTTEAQAGNVKSIDISGSQGTAFDKAGQKHQVNLPSDTAPVATTLASEGVEVRYTASSGTNWLQVLLPNVILLVVIGGFMFFLYRRRRLPPG